MPTVNLSPIFNGTQVFGADGLPLSAGLLWTYQAGTSTPEATYTTNAGNIANTNPIVLGSDGRPPQEIWLIQGQAYKFVLMTALSITIETYDNIPGMNDMSALSASSGSSLIGFIQSGSGAQARTAQSKMRELVSVKDFGAVGDGATDDTAAFNAARATGKRVFVPAGIYSVSDIALADGAYFFGDGDGRNGATILRVRANNTAAFRNSVAANAFLTGVVIRDMRIEAAAGITGAKGYRQDNHDGYLAYSSFERVDTSKNLQIGYDGFFIFTTWRDCRDGYFGSPPGAQDHWSIDSNPVSTAQAFQTNRNRLVGCELFGSTSGASAAIDIQYGSGWSFEDCDFEQLACPAIRSRGVFQGAIRNCWFESIAAASVIVLDDCPAPNAQSSSVWAMDDCTLVAAGNAGGVVFNVLADVTVSVRGLFALLVNAGTTLINLPAQLRDLAQINVLSGAGAAGFLTGIRAQVYNTEMMSGILNSPQAQNLNVLPIGPSGLGQANFTNNGFTAKADVASQIGLAGNAVQFTLSNAGNAAYYTLPAKLVTFLQGRTVTFAITGFGGAVAGESFKAAVWDSVGVPAFGNETATSAGIINSGNVALQTAYVTLTVSSGASSLDLGFRAGGNANTGTVNVESAKLLLGMIKPDFAGLL